MRYNLGYMDKYPIEACGTIIENNPMYRIVFKEPIDPIRLESAFYDAMNIYPLFKTEVRFKKEYYLQTNNRPIIIIKASEEERPLVFGKQTNGYPWQCCYYEDKLTFEWLHGISDGIGAFNFLKQVLLFYFEVDNANKNNKYLIAPGLEPFFDSREKGDDYNIDPEGFSFNDFPKIKNRGYKTDCHLLKANTIEILNLSKNTKSSVAPIITILFSQAIRKHLPVNIKNRNVACNIVLDLRRPLNYETMHNCVEYKRITYIDEYDSLSFTDLARHYKEMLDKSRLSSNVVKTISDRVSIFNLVHKIHNKKLIKFVIKVYASIFKDRDCNFVVTYPGKVDLPKEIIKRLESIDFKVWHDFGECIIACMDFDGTFYMNISENFVDKGVIDDFIDLSSKLGIYWSEIESGEFEQAHFEEE